MKPTPSLRHLPPRRLLAIAAAIALISSGQVDAKSNNKRPKNSLDGSEVVCPLGTFICAPRPDNFALCRPNAMLDFYDPTLTTDTSLRTTSNTYGWAEHVDSTDQTVYHMSGHVQMIRADQKILADRVDYNEDTTDYDARGNVRYQEAGKLLQADHMTGNTNDSRGVAIGDVRYQMLDSHGNGVAVRGEEFDAVHSRYSMATYSTCDIGHHVWEIRAKKIDTDKDAGRGVARSATMRLYNVPFLYLPYMSFPLNNERQSGFLYPYFEHTGSAGYLISEPYYLNLAPNYDATIDPRIYSERGAMLGGEFRYLFPGTVGALNFFYLPSDNHNDQADSPTAPDTLHQDRYLVKYTDYTALWPGWALGVNINRASDQNYLHDFGDNLYTLATGTLASSAYLYGSGSWWSASFGVDDYQNVDPSLPDSSEQYRRWPRATFNMDLPFDRWYDVGLTSEAVAFRKANVVQGDRLDLNPYIDADFQGAAWFVRPTLAYRYTGYQLDSGYQNYGYYGPVATGQSPFTSADPSRSMPIVSLDNGLIFERQTSVFGTSYTQTLEPRLYYLYAPYRNQDDLPLFDTSLMSFDYWELFTPNLFSSADRQINANNLSAAVTTRLLDDGGVERVSLSFGQIRYFTPQRIQLPGVPPTDWSGSDYVAELDAQLNDQWKFTSSYQWNPNTHQTDLSAFGIQRRIGFDGILNFSYRFRRGLLEQYDVSAVYPLSDRWRLIGDWTYSVMDRRTVEAVAGVQYESCCIKLSLVERHYVTGYDGITVITPTSGPGTDTAIMFELEFKGMGAFSGQTDSLLRRDILGYQ